MKNLAAKLALSAVLLFSPAVAAPIFEEPKPFIPSYITVELPDLPAIYKYAMNPPFHVIVGYDYEGQSVKASYLVTGKSRNGEYDATYDPNYGIRQKK